MTEIIGETTQVKSIKKNYLYNLLYQIVTIVSPMITAPYISRVLGAENIGIYSFVAANTTYFLLVGTFGLSTYSQFEVAKLREDKSEVSQLFVESCATRVVTFGGCGLLFYVFVLLRGGQYVAYYTIQAVLLFSHMIDITWLFQGFEDFGRIALKNCVIRAITVVLIFVFVKRRSDLAAYFWISAGGALAGNLSIIPGIRKYLSFQSLGKINILKHLRQSSVYFLPSIASVLISTVDKLMIGYHNVSKVENGYYEQAVKIENMIFMIFASLNITMRPRMAYLFKAKRTEEIKTRMMKSLRFVSLLVFAMSFGLFAISDSFVDIYYGEGYKPVSLLLKIMTFWIVIKSFSSCVCEQYVMPNDGMVRMNKSIWVAAVTNIVFNSIMIPKHGAVGAAIASVISEVSFYLIIRHYARDVYSVKDFIYMVYKHVLSAFVMIIAIFFIGRLLQPSLLSLIITVFTGAVVYCCALTLLRDNQFHECKEVIRQKLRARLQ